MTREPPPLGTQRNILSPKAGHFSATGALQVSCGHCKTYAGAVLEKKPAMDLPPGSNY